jgi:hypothetical protein
LLCRRNYQFLQEVLDVSFEVSDACEICAAARAWQTIIRDDVQAPIKNVERRINQGVQKLHVMNLDDAFSTPSENMKILREVVADVNVFIRLEVASIILQASMTDQIRVLTGSL